MPLPRCTWWREGGLAPPTLPPQNSWLTVPPPGPKLELSLDPWAILKQCLLTIKSSAQVGTRATSNISMLCVNHTQEDNTDKMMASTFMAAFSSSTRPHSPGLRWGSCSAPGATTPSVWSGGQRSSSSVALTTRRNIYFYKQYVLF